MKSIKEYAKEQGVSYEAIRRMVSRYSDELKPFLVKEGKKTYLTDKAIQFLEQKRNSNPTIIINQARDEEIDRLRSENERLNHKVEALQDMIIQMSAERSDLLVELKEKTLLLEVRDSQPTNQGRLAAYFSKFFGKN